MELHKRHCLLILTNSNQWHHLIGVLLVAAFVIEVVTNTSTTMNVCPMVYRVQVIKATMLNNLGDKHARLQAAMPLSLRMAQLLAV